MSERRGWREARKNPAQPWAGKFAFFALTYSRLMPDL
jgi:hypothetical protein